MDERVLAIDLGASSGRVMAGKIEDGKIVYDEVHRFQNGGTRINGTLFWDFEHLFSNIKEGLKKASQLYKVLSIGIDTWGVDFGQIDKDGKLLRSPVHYRDERTDNIYEEVFKIIPKSEIYSLAGIQFIRFNTLYQLYYSATYEKELWDKTDKILLMPDLIAYMLTGKMRLERTNASTTNLLNAHNGVIDESILSRLNIKSSVFAPIIEPGETYGVVKDDLANELGLNGVPVVAVCTHDTASAVASVPTTVKSFAYISSGTWSLLGTELSRPLTTKQAEESNLTNEVGYGKSIRFLKNIMGLWILQQTRQFYISQGKTVSFSDMEKMALSVTDNDKYIDVDDALFELPGDMLSRVDEYLAKTGQGTLDGDEKKIRCIYESLALKYAFVISALEKTVGNTFETLHVVGGGIQAKLLCEMTANAVNKRVVCGPIEATATGNIAVQYIALGKIKDISSARKMVTSSPDIYTLTPANATTWREKYEKYLSVITEKGE